MTVFLVTGAQASGKTSVAQALAERFPRSAHVHGDYFRTMIVHGRREMAPGADPDAALQLELRHRLTAIAADAYHDAGFTVVVQDVVIGPYLAAMAGAIRGRPLHVVVLTPDPDVIAVRDAERDKTAYGGAWTVRELDRIVHSETARIGLWLDTSALSVQDTVDEILARLPESEVRGPRD